MFQMSLTTKKVDYIFQEELKFIVFVVIFVISFQVIESLHLLQN